MLWNVCRSGEKTALRAHPQIECNTDISILGLRWRGPEPIHRLPRIERYSQWQAAIAVALTKSPVTSEQLLQLHECL